MSIQPDRYTNSETMLPVSDGHQLYVHDWGNLQSAVPIVSLHGGPGDGTPERVKRWFNPETQRAIFFDQRGAGQSTPSGSLEHNTTQDLVEDIDRVAEHAKLGTYATLGGSWGACLGLVHAIQHPQRTEPMVFTGIFTGTIYEADWVDKGQVAAVEPAAWQAYVDSTPAEHRADPTPYHFAQMLGLDPQAARQSAYVYENLFEAMTVMGETHVPEPIDDFDPIPARTVAHYTVHKYFLPDQYVFDNAHKITAPVTLVQGKHDHIVPAVAAQKLHALLPNSTLHLTNTGHRGGAEADSLISAALAAITRQLPKPSS